MEPLQNPVFQKQVNDSADVFVSPANDWHNSEDEGQLAVDVYDAGDDLVIVAPMAGIYTDKIDAHIHNDLLTIRGERSRPVFDYAAQILNECFWGKFSRTIVLPTEVKGELATSEYENGILKITIPKRNTDSKVVIEIVDE